MDTSVAVGVGVGFGTPSTGAGGVAPVPQNIPMAWFVQGGAEVPMEWEAGASDIAMEWQG